MKDTTKDFLSGLVLVCFVLAAAGALVWAGQVNGIAQYAKEHDRLNQQHDQGEAGKPKHPPLVRRFVISILLIALGLFWAFSDSDNGRSGFRATFARGGLGGLVLCGFGLVLWWITFAFPSTWDWWL